jgi:hypothetical protein
MTAEERTRIQEAARRFVREQAPTPPLAILEQVVRIVLNVRRPAESTEGPARSVEGCGKWEARDTVMGPER